MTELMDFDDQPKQMYYQLKELVEKWELKEPKEEESQSV